MSQPSTSASKCVLLVADHLSAGLAVNAAAVLSLSLGDRVEGLIGPEVKDADGHAHAGITLLPVPVLRAGAERIARVAARAADEEDVVVVGFTDTAQGCRTYDEYTDRMGGIPTADLTYVGLGLFGPRKPVNRLTGDLPLLR
ncbi:DUF2000 domain-containing protein [Streptomyces carminius]|uniref:DUF2000 domain-containing protein n=1 Tax=Streptomyces carminius TaxID=2665496 RepID=A0A2M8LVU9_9ACTN|nr:DUF2000 domain-containing protein [Streptomyces carminius]PJE96083.1 DUF2000 domain-containing protein [Streptomyces carminius]